EVDRSHKFGNHSRHEVDRSHKFGNHSRHEVDRSHKFGNHSRHEVDRSRYNIHNYSLNMVTPTSILLMTP
ncbi:MAG: hypothetical protein V7K27_23500, partial [Nostoc sp.]|uniref:hypothetical protein n=1 Tax=Nostoc sp. TaxID=1180 RepID=UPI002FF84137